MSAGETVQEPLRERPVDKGLRRGALGFVASFMSALASTGPALALAAVLGAVVASVGSSSLGIMIVATIPMLMVARTFWELDVAERDCGTTFVWVGRALGPSAGFMSAWGQLAASLMVIPASAFTLAQYSFALLRLDRLTTSTTWVILVGLLMILGLGAICYLGVEVAARAQRILVVLEVLIVVALIIVTVIRIASGDALASGGHFQAAWLNPFGGSGDVADALVVAVFAYWGWDLAFTLGEETTGEATPGKASITSIFALAVLYTVGLAVFLAYAGPNFLAKNASLLLSAIGNSVLGAGLATTFITLAVLTSAMAATQATFVASSRLLLSMGAYRALPAWFRKVNRYQSPTSTVLVVAVGALLFVAMATFSTDILFDSLSCTGMIICFYYGLTVFACAWRFRATLRMSVGNLLWRGVVPVIAGVILIWALVQSAISYVDPANSGGSLLGVGLVFWFAIGMLALGCVLAVVVRFTAREYASGRTMASGYAATLEDPRPENAGVPHGQGVLE